MNGQFDNRKGYTFLEIVMVIVLLGIIGMVTFQVVFSGVETFSKARNRKELYDGARLAMERMVREIRDANQIDSPPSGSSGGSINFDRQHVTVGGDASTDITFQLNGTDLERVGDVSGTVDLASNVSNFQVTREGISFDNARRASIRDNNTLTIPGFPIGGGSNRILVVGVSIEHPTPGPIVSNLTFNGQPLTYYDFEQVSDAGPGYMARVELWYMLEDDLPPAGSYDVVVTASVSPTRAIAAGAISLEGGAQQRPEASNKNTGVAPPNTIQTTVTTVTNGAWIIDVVGCGNAGTYAPDPGQTERWDWGTNTHRGAGSTEVVAIAGAATVGWTHSGANRQALLAAAFAPSNIITLDLTLSTAEAGSVSMQGKVYPRNLP